jgi:TetR/AcrR family transcriptional regulator, regulator of cefoperazone and chloramphenicol sensitivity
MKQSIKMISTTAAPLTAPPADTRQRLLESAGVVFAEQGFHQATIRQITDRAGVNLAAVNYHFRDKSELYAAVMRDCFCSSAAHPAIDPGLPPEAQLHAWISRFVSIKYGSATPSWKHQLVAREMQEPTPALAALVEENICPEARELEGIVRALHPGDLSSDQAYLMGFSIVGQILYYLNYAPLNNRIHPPFATDPPDVATLTEHIHRFSLAALVHYHNPGPPRKRKK